MSRKSGVRKPLQHAGHVTEPLQCRTARRQALLELYCVMFEPKRDLRIKEAKITLTFFGKEPGALPEIRLKALHD